MQLTIRVGHQWFQRKDQAERAIRNEMLLTVFALLPMGFCATASSAWVTISNNFDPQCWQNALSGGLMNWH
jgi:FtsH-binding integral membrane protein